MIFFLNPDEESEDEAPSGGEIDNDQEDEFVGHVTVQDPDEGDNGHFECHLNTSVSAPPSFYFRYRLRRIYETEFLIVRQRRRHQNDPDLRPMSPSLSHPLPAAAADRQEDYFRLVCVDRGRPEMTSSVGVRVVGPMSGVEFEAEEERVTIDENNAVGDVLMTLKLVVLSTIPPPPLPPGMYGWNIYFIDVIVAPNI